MKENTILTLDERYLNIDCIWLEGPRYYETADDDFEIYDRPEDISDLEITVHGKTGEVLQVLLEGFVRGTVTAVEMLRACPVPWTFSLPSMGLKEKPLEDILLAIWTKYRDIKMEWD